MRICDFDRYLRYDELVGVLQSCKRDFSGLVDLHEIGKSHEGRAIWLAEVTDFSTGPAADKPAFWCDGNIHASEVSASTAVLMILQTLLAGHSEGDADVVRLLQERTFYLVPRLNPDGAEWALETPPRIVRSSTRRYPFDEEEPEGLERKDIDGDGRLLQMRVPDPNGAWVKDEIEPRLLRRRKPGERADECYRVLPEGVIHGYDGLTLKPRRIPQGLDFNRNFPSAWRIESDQHGAGPYPTSEPEIRAAVQAIVDRPNICGAMAFHTFSGVLLRPPSRMPDDDVPPEDIWTFKALGEKGHELTGYPAISNFHEFKYHPKEVITGVFDDWMYEHRGVHAWTVEIWSPQRKAGITDYKYIDWFREHPPEDDRKIIQWSDENIGGRGYVDWKEFDHPQLGKVEIGGWDFAEIYRNPPVEFLEDEVRPLAEWALWHAATGPRLEVRDVLVEPLGDATIIRFAAQNTGWLPTNVTKIADERKLCRGVQGRISRVGEAGGARGNWLLSGDPWQDGGQLTGWSHIAAGGFGAQMNGTTDICVFEWVVSEPGEYEIEAIHERAGRVVKTVSVS